MHSSNTILISLYVLARAVLSDTMYVSINFRKSTPSTWKRVVRRGSAARGCPPRSPEGRGEDEAHVIQSRPDLALLVKVLEMFQGVPSSLGGGRLRTCSLFARKRYLKASGAAGQRGGRMPSQKPRRARREGRGRAGKKDRARARAGAGERERGTEKERERAPCHAFQRHNPAFILRPRASACLRVQSYLTQCMYQSILENQLPAPGSEWCGGAARRAGTLPDAPEGGERTRHM